MITCLPHPSNHWHGTSFNRSKTHMKQITLPRFSNYSRITWASNKQLTMLQQKAFHIHGCSYSSLVLQSAFFRSGQQVAAFKLCWFQGSSRHHPSQFPPRLAPFCVNLTGPKLNHIYLKDFLVVHNHCRGFSISSPVVVGTCQLPSSDSYIPTMVTASIQFF